MSAQPSPQSAPRRSRTERRVKEARVAALERRLGAAGAAAHRRVDHGDALGLQLLVHLRPEAVHQHQLDAHGMQYGQILREVSELAGGDQHLERRAGHHLCIELAGRAG